MSHVCIVYVCIFYLFLHQFRKLYYVLTTTHPDRLVQLVVYVDAMGQLHYHVWYWLPVTVAHVHGWQLWHMHW